MILIKNIKYFKLLFQFSYSKVIFLNNIKQLNKKAICILKVI